MILAEFFGHEIGKLPKILRRDVKTVWIHQGHNPFGGGNENLLIHIQQAEDYNKRGNLGDTLIHESSHTSIDFYLYGTEMWNKAVSADNKFISDYAKDNPEREDIAETYLVWFATRYRKETFT